MNPHSSNTLDGLTFAFGTAGVGLAQLGTLLGQLGTFLAGSAAIVTLILRLCESRRPRPSEVSP